MSGRVEGGGSDGGAEAKFDDARLVLSELSVAAAGIGTFDWDLTTGRLAWDDRLIELFGYQRGRFGERIEDFNARVHPDDLPDVTARLTAAVETGGDYDATYRVERPDGTQRWVAARGRALRDPSGVTTRVLGAAWDVTDAYEAEVRLAQVLESMSTAFFSLDPTWRFTYVNAQAEELLGRPRTDLLGGVVWELFPAAVGSDFETNYRHAMDTGEPASFEAYYPAPLDAWFEVRAWRNPAGLAVYFLDITARSRAAAEQAAAAARNRLLERITEQLITSLSPEDAATTLARLVVPDLADWAIVTLIRDGAAQGRRAGLSPAGACHADPALQPLVEAYAAQRLDALTDDAIVVRTMETGGAQFIDADATRVSMAMLTPGPARELLADLAPEAVAIYPLTGRNGPVGMLTLGRGPARGALDEVERLTAAHVGARAGLVLENARLYRQLRDLAEGLQRAMLTPPPEPDHLQVVVRYAPAAQVAQVGGDWYDAFVQPGGSLVLVIGDVVGHDTQAAAAMGQVRTLLRGFGAIDRHGPAAVLTHVDRVIANLDLGATATAVVARLEQTPAESHRGVTHLRWSNAGHLPPMVVNADGSVLTLSQAGTDLLLGVLPDTPRHEFVISLDHEDTVVLYTDGLVERRTEPLEQGLARLQDTLAALAGEGLTLDDLCDRTLAAMVPDVAEDDVALIAVRLHPRNLPRPPEAGPRRLPPTVADTPAVLDQPE